LYKCAENYKDFSILAPRIEGVNYKNEYYVKKNVSPNVHSMNFVTGCALFFSMDALDVIGKFDEKIFLYYEENDLYLRSLKKDFKIYLVENSQIKHIGNASTDLINKRDIEISRNWHLMWSTFYFHQKHYGLIVAYYKTFFKLLSASFKYSVYSILVKSTPRKIYFARMSGILNAMMGKKSWFRTKIDKGID